MGPVGGASKVPSREDLIRLALKRSRASKRTPLGERKKFLKHSVKVKLARTMTGRTVASRSADLETVPSGGLQSCFMRDAIEDENMKNPSAAYNEFFRAIYGMVQSQALLLHNQHRIVDLIMEHLERPDRVDPS